MSPRTIRAIALLAAAPGPLGAQATGDSPLGPGDHRVSPSFAGERREYLVHVPPGYRGQVAVPLVIMLHGSGGTIDWDLKATAWTDKADVAGFVVVFPQARKRDNGIAAFGEDDVGFIDSVIDQLRSRLKLDPSRVFVTGFSNGAWLSFQLGLKLGHRIAAIAPVAGLPRLDGARLKQPVPALFIIGTRDEFNPIDGGDIETPTGTRHRLPVKPAVLEWAGQLGCPAAPSDSSYQDGIRSETYGPCRKRSEVIIKVIDQWQHYWPGGPEAPRKGGGNLDRWAENTIWDFFRRHPR